VDVIFEPVKVASHNGMVVSCGDNIRCVLYPGTPIEVLDGEEACSACACRAALANHPCPCCLVHHDQLDMIDQQFPPQTTETMQQVYHDAQAASTKTAAEDILKAYGLHATKVWKLLYSVL
jgi:sorbitol-specific phosphotransferase system component IIBC